MASKTERTVIDAAGLVQGIVRLDLPRGQARSSPTRRVRAVQHPVRGHVPASGRAGHRHVAARRGLARRITTKRVYLLGLTCSIASMVLLLASTLVKTNQAAAYPLLLVGTAFLGAGFGLTVPVLNTYTSVFHPAASTARC